MQARESVRFMECHGRERNEELIGVLLAISVVSKRLAGKLIALEHLEAKKNERRKTIWHPTKCSNSEMTSRG